MKNPRAMKNSRAMKIAKANAAEALDQLASISDYEDNMRWRTRLEIALDKIQKENTRARREFTNVSNSAIDDALDEAFWALCQMNLNR